jgi:hypothetical protein
MNGDLKGLGQVLLHVDLDYSPSFSFSLNEGALLGNGFVTVHVEVDLFSSRVAVEPKHYLLGDSHVSLPPLRNPLFCGAVFSFPAARFVSATISLRTINRSRRSSAVLALMNLSAVALKNTRSVSRNPSEEPSQESTPESCAQLLQSCQATGKESTSGPNPNAALGGFRPPLLSLTASRAESEAATPLPEGFENK